MNSDRQMYLAMFGVVAATLLVAALIGVEMIGGRWRDAPSRGVVLGRDFRRSHLVHGTMVVGAKPPIVVPTVRSVPDRWTATVKLGDGVVTAEVAHRRWESLRPGEVVSVQQRTSPLLGWINGTRVR